MKKLIVLAGVFAALGFGLTACDTKVKGDTKAEYSYAMGAQVGKNIKAQKIDMDIKAFAQGLKDATEGKELQLDEKAQRAAMQKMADKRREGDKKLGAENLKKGEAFLEANKSKDGVKVTESGLQYKVIKPGKGKSPKKEDSVSVHYAGRLIDGTEFDSSLKRGEPAKFPVGQVIPGWTEALQLMKEGAKYELYIPAKLAYGERGNPSIPPNSVLIFDVELLKVVR